MLCRGGLQAIDAPTRIRLLCGGSRETETMDQQEVWERISTAPYDRDLELAVIEGGRVHALVFACRRTVSGWVKVPTRERISISPTHWRLWRRRDQD